MILTIFRDVSKYIISPVTFPSRKWLRVAYHPLEKSRSYPISMARPFFTIQIWGAQHPTAQGLKWRFWNSENQLFSCKAKLTWPSIILHLRRYDPKANLDVLLDPSGLQHNTEMRWHLQIRTYMNFLGVTSRIAWGELKPNSRPQ